MGCKKMSGVVPHMMAGILGAFSDEILTITNEAATAEVRIKKRKHGMIPRLAPNHMTYVKKHADFRTFLADVHFRNVWTAQTGQPASGPALLPSEATKDKDKDVPSEPDPHSLLACEKPAVRKLKKMAFMTRSKDKRPVPAAPSSGVSTHKPYGARTM